MPGNTGKIIDRTQVFNRLMWLVRIRWLVLMAVLMLVCLAFYLDIISRLTPLVTTISVLVFFNLSNFLVLKHGPMSTKLSTRTLCLWQIITDILGILVLVHFTGGLTNPAVFFLAAPVMVGGLVLRPRWTYLLAATALGMAALLCIFESRNWIEHHEVRIFHEQEDARTLHDRMCASLISVGCLLFTSAYLVCKIVEALKKKEMQYLKVQTAIQKGHLRRLAGTGQRRTALSGLAEGIGREVQTPLGVIKARVDSIRYDLEEMESGNSVLFDDLQVIYAKAEQIQNTVDKISTFLNHDIKKKQRLDTGGLLNGIAAAAKKMGSDKGISVSVRIAPGLREIEGSREAIEKLFSAVIQNAFEAVEDAGGGKISIHARMLNGITNRVMIRIRDDGPGIAPKVQEKIFDPFFSTRGSNRGMGLAIAYTIVKNHGGEFRVRSRPPPGTSVSVLLPIPVSSARERKTG